MASGWARPEASRRHVRRQQAGRPEASLSLACFETSLRLRRGAGPAREQEVKACQPQLSCLGSRTEGLTGLVASDTLDKPDLGRAEPAGGLGAGGRPSGWHALRCAGAGQAGPEVGCWLGWACQPCGLQSHGWVACFIHTWA